MSSSGVRESNDNVKRTIRGLILNEEQFIQTLRIFANTSSLVGLGASGGEINNSPNEASGNFMARAGDFWLGQVGNAFDTITATNINNDTINVSKTDGVTFPVVILQGESPPTADDLVTIIQGDDVFPFQELVIRTRSSIITIKNSDNINTPDGLDLVLPVGSIIHLYFDSFLGEWVIDGGTPFFGGGDGSSFPILYPKIDLTPAISFNQTIDLSVDTGNAKQIQFPAGDIGLQIIGDPANTVGEDVYVLFIQDSVGGRSLATVDSAIKNGGLMDGLLDKAANARTLFRLATLDGGATYFAILVDLTSDGANTALSNLTSPTSINQSLLFSTTGFDIANTTNPVNHLFFGTGRLQTNTLVANKPSFTTLSGDTFDVNFPTGSSFNIYENAAIKHQFSASSLTTPNIILSNSLLIQDSTADPSGTGIFTRNGDDVKVLSGGAVRNLSDIGVAAGVQDAEFSTTHETSEFDHQIWLSHAKQGDKDQNQTSSIFGQVPQEAIFFYPFYIAKDTTVVRIGVDVGTLVAEDMSVAIYDSNGGQTYPNTRISASINQIMNTTGIFSIFVNKPITAGLYWIATWFDDGNSSTIRGFPIQSCNCAGWATAGDSTGALTPVVAYVESFFTSPALPSTAPTEMAVFSLNILPACFILLN